MQIPSPGIHLGPRTTSAWLLLPSLIPRHMGSLPGLGVVAAAFTYVDVAGNRSARGTHTHAAKDRALTTPETQAAPAIGCLQQHLPWDLDKQPLTARPLPPLKLAEIEVRQLRHTQGALCSQTHTCLCLLGVLAQLSCPSSTPGPSYPLHRLSTHHLIQPEAQCRHMHTNIYPLSWPHLNVPSAYHYHPTTYSPDLMSLLLTGWSSWMFADECTRTPHEHQVREDMNTLPPSSQQQAHGLWYITQLQLPVQSPVLTSLRPDPTSKFGSTHCSCPLVPIADAGAPLAPVAGTTDHGLHLVHSHQSLQ